MKTSTLFCCAAFLAPAAVLACDACKLTQPAPGQRVVEYDLRIAEARQSPAGKLVRVLTINGGIPGPTLRFREGDFARIRVHNDLRSETTSTHWHGLLLPNPQDGVPHVTTPPILPGTTHTFGFTLRHGGTYWYHSHTHLQEQSGVYGAIVVTPRGGERVKADREEVLVLSDWTNIHPEEVQRMLMRGTDYFALKRGNAPSLLGATQKGMLKQYAQNQWDRMMPMDLSDVASWESADAARAAVSSARGSAGVVTVAAAAAPGPVLITARRGTISSSATITINMAVTLQRLDLAVDQTLVPVGLTARARAFGTYSDGVTTFSRDVTEQVTWSATGAAMISNAAGEHGLITGNMAGAASVGATLDGVTGATVPITVTACPLNALQIADGA
ncbi:MAG: multicopper oxidase domain-containing protein, partial [Roseimicrobium sp.]